MQAPFEMTVGLARLREILSSRPIDSPYWNEAQNRFQFIDRLLSECLGWEKPYIEVENTDDFGGKADYLLGKPARAILEAKREARSFDLLPSGAPIAIVCNGPQLIVFQAIVMGQSPLDGECYVFNGFDTYLENFPLLWTILSPEGVYENRAYKEFSLHRTSRIPPKASTAISEPNKYRYRNTFQENLRSLASLLLEDIIDDPAVKPTFYRECYVSSEANNRHLLLSKQAISARYKRAGGDGIMPASLEVATKVDEAGGLKITDPALSILPGTRPIVVLGDIGVGKTSFFENLFEQLDV